MLEPDGLSDLTQNEMLRVGQANLLYQFVADTISLCNELNKWCMVENPANSLFWLVTPMIESLAVRDLFIQDHQACAYGSSRPKWKFSQVHTIDQTCPGNHFHEPWGKVDKGNKKVFATALEVHYPKGLCDAIANAFALRLALDGWKPQESHASNAAAAASTGLQPNKSKLPPLIPEFKSKICVLSSIDDVICWPHKMPDVSLAKLTHNFSVGGKDSESVFQNVTSACKALSMDVVIPPESVNVRVHFLKVFGFWWEPEEFVSKALQVNHPLAAEPVVPHILLEEVKVQVQAEPFEIAKRRLKFVAKWTSRAKALAADEIKLKNKMDPLVSEVVKNKRILLFEEMLKEVNFPDMGVVDELRNGASLTGDIPVTNMLPSKFVPPMLDESSLAHRASLLRESAQGHASSSGDPHVDKEVWEKTIEEVSLSWLKGPLELVEVPVSSPITRWFGRKQKHKTRLIDDYTQSGVNHFVTVHEAPSLHTVDIAASLVTVWLRACKSQQRHSALQIKTFDLSSAYKQIALNASGREYSFISVWDPVPGRQQTKVLSVSRTSIWLSTQCS